jgi:carbonic anhydrase
VSEIGVISDLNKTIQDLNQSIMSFEQNFPLAQFSEGNFKQHPIITLLTCSDSRMPVDIFGSLFNRIFCVENIGNQVKSSEGSILYGLFHLHTPLMIIAGHTDCGAINAAGSNFAHEPEAIINELSVVRNSLEQARQTSCFKVEDSPLGASQLAELNVDMQINFLLANNKIAQLVQENHLTILGVLADLHNIHGNGYGKIYTLNVNGEHKAEVLKDYSHLGRFADQALRLTEY